MAGIQMLQDQSTFFDEVSGHAVTCTVLEADGNPWGVSVYLEEGSPVATALLSCDSVPFVQATIADARAMVREKLTVGRCYCSTTFLLSDDSNDNAGICCESCWAIVETYITLSQKVALAEVVIGALTEAGLTGAVWALYIPTQQAFIYSKEESLDETKRQMDLILAPEDGATSDNTVHIDTEVATYQEQISVLHRRVHRIKTRHKDIIDQNLPSALEYFKKQGELDKV